MIPIDINPNILSQLQQDSNATKEIVKSLKIELIKYSEQNSKNERMKIQKSLLQYLLPTLLESITIKEEILKYLDLSEVSFDGINIEWKNFKDSNANIDPQTVQGKTLFFTNLKGVDLSHANFTGVDIKFANLENTGAQIDPQLIKNKSLYDTNVKGCTFVNLSYLDSIKRIPVDFTDVDIQFANLEDTGAQIDPQLIKDKSLTGTNVKGCTFVNLSSLDSIKRVPADFTDVDIQLANLEDTDAQINPQLIKDKSLHKTNLKGVDLSHANFTDVDIWGANLEGTSAIINPHTVHDRALYETNLNYCTLIDDGNLEEIYYSQSTSLNYVKFATLKSQKANNPMTTLQKKLNKVFKKKRKDELK